MNAYPHRAARQTVSLPRQSRLGVLVFLGIVAAGGVIVSAAAPEGWMIAGSQPTRYKSSVDTTTLYEGHRSAYLKSKEQATGGFGTLMQSFDAKNYLGARVRLSAAVKTEDVQSWAGLWMRVDKGSQTVEFDNMQDRPLKGTAGWKKSFVVLDVPRMQPAYFSGSCSIVRERSGSAM